MKCLVLSSRTYRKKSGGEGVRTCIVFRNQDGLECNTVFGSSLYSAGSIYNFEFDPNGFLTSVSDPEPCEAFELLKECF